jgi:CheY-like chemotaxis protein
VLRVYLPVAPTAAPAADGAATPPAEREHVLVVEPDPLVLQLMSATLGRAGYRVKAAPDGGRALEQFAAATDPFHLVLADVALPHMTGFDLVRHLLARDPAVRVLFTSSYVPANPPGEEFGGRDFDLLPKPFRPDGLLRAVRAALDRLPHSRATAPVPGVEAVPAATQPDLTRRISW